jgi:hypothetical protein
MVVNKLDMRRLLADLGPVRYIHIQEGRLQSEGQGMSWRYLLIHIGLPSLPTMPFILMFIVLITWNSNSLQSKKPTLIWCKIVVACD